MAVAGPAAKAKSFRTPAEFRRWLEKNRDGATELWIRLFKVHASHRGIGYKAALDEALCFGWIDGALKPLDEDSFLRRFTPRSAKSIWSNVNLRHVKRLESEGRMHAAGRAAFARRTEDRTGVYSFETRPKTLPAAFLAEIRADARAWKFFSTRAPWVQRITAHWVTTAKQEETRRRRFAILIASARRGAWLHPLTILEKSRPARKAGGPARSGRAKSKASASGARRPPTRSSRPRSRS